MGVTGPDVLVRAGDAGRHAADAGCSGRGNLCLGLLARIGELALATCIRRNTPGLQQTLEYRDIPWRCWSSVRLRWIIGSCVRRCSQIGAAAHLPRAGLLCGQPEESGYAEGSREYVMAHSLHLSSFIAGRSSWPKRRSAPILVGLCSSWVGVLPVADPVPLPRCATAWWSGRLGDSARAPTLEIPPVAELVTRGEAIAASLPPRLKLGLAAPGLRWMSAPAKAIRRGGLDQGAALGLPMGMAAHAGADRR